MDNYLWQTSQLGDALIALKKQLRWKTGEIQIPTASNEAEIQREKLNERITSLADTIGIKAEPVMVQYDGIENLLKKAPPAIFLIQKEDQPFLLIVLNCHGDTLEVLGNDLLKHKLSIRMIPWGNACWEKFACRISAVRFGKLESQRSARRTFGSA